MTMTSGEAVKYKSSFDAFSQILKNEGAKSLFKGAGANILRALAGAGALAGYDKLQVTVFGKKYGSSVLSDERVLPELEGSSLHMEHLEVTVWFGVSKVVAGWMLKNNWPRPDNYTYPLLLKTCACLSLILVGNGILGHVYKWGFDSDAFVFNAMVHMLVSCGEFEIARKEGRAHEALDVYREMKMGNCRPDGVTLIGVVSACGQLEDLELGKELHRYIEENGLNLKVPLANALMDMYVKCGELKRAKALLKSKSLYNLALYELPLLCPNKNREILLQTMRLAAKGIHYCLEPPTNSKKVMLRPRFEHGISAIYISSTLFERDQGGNSGGQMLNVSAIRLFIATATDDSSGRFLLIKSA
ncbi:hypothetical protein RJ639_038448 [Escallonia herrerae]|uniref:Pentatricopeptide repeat-containing protein n=1 Tax=Escallonia herrerae TaxID=1293975 RepID=A0AA88WMK0_9ASTE|nr:hypothetical protein RJ639_038448 [Escallonia herrerae]